mgnify:CR=1 FL=1
MADAPASSRRNLLLHPLTHEVYALDDMLVHRSNVQVDNRVKISFSDFEKLTQTGPCSAERIVEYAKRRHGAFHFSQIVFLQMKSGPDEQPRFAWASRICVEVDQTIPQLKSGGCFGFQFLWIWPPSAAINAFLTYQERNRLSLVFSTMLEQYAPSVSHLSAAPGAQIGPDDFDGAVHVPFAKLTAEKRFFISCIRPQRTQFQRRLLTDQWPTVMQDAENAAKLKFQVSHIASRSAVEANELTNAVIWVNQRRDDQRPRKRAPSSVFALENLPDDIFTRIVGCALTDEMTKHRTDAAKTICALRGVSKQMRLATDGFMGLMLERLTAKMVAYVCGKYVEPVRSLSAQVRAIGITPRQALELRSSDLVKPSEGEVALYPQLRDTHFVPRWQRYLKMRLEIDRSVSAEKGYVRTKEQPSKTYKRLRVLGRSNIPNIESVAMRPEYDGLIAKGGVASDHAGDVLELAGV